MAYCVAAFSSTHDAIQAERRLREICAVQTMPTPRCVSASCGISLRFPPAQAGRVRAALEALPGAAGRWALYLVEDGAARPI